MGPSTTGISQGLYCSEEEIALRVLGPGRLRDWHDRARILERRGLPRIDPFMGGRYWPSVRAFFDRLNGLTDSRTMVPSKPDQPEKWKLQPNDPLASRKAQIS